MTVVAASPGRLAPLVSRPDASDLGRASLAFHHALVTARQSGRRLYVLPSADAACAPLTGVRSSDVEILRPRGFARAWLSAVWRAARDAERAGAWIAKRRGAFWRECYRELRRHVGDERLPYALRARLRAVAQACLARAESEEAAGYRFPRRLLRERVALRLPDALERAARARAAALGIHDDAPVVVLEARGRADAFGPAVDFLADAGYTIASLGEGAKLPRTIAVPTASGEDAMLNLFLRLRAAFVVCDAVDAQWVSYATNTPCLLANAVDAFSGYPVRADGLYLLKPAVDLDSGRRLTPADRLTPEYYRNLRSCAHRDNSAAEIAEAVREMESGVRGGFAETAGQRRYRALVTDAGGRLAPQLRQVEKWGPEDGFIGDGRLARIQADVLS